MGRFGRRLSVAGVLVLAAACGPGGPADETPASPVPAAAAHCPTTINLESPPDDALPADFTVAWVFRCLDEERTVPGDGRWWFRIQQRADTDAAALLAALRRPDETTSPGTLCPDVAYRVEWFAVVDATGRVVRPRVPRNACGQPQRHSLDSLAALPFREVSALATRQEESQKALDTGCHQLGTTAPSYDILESDKPGQARTLWKRAPEAVKICLSRIRAGRIELVSSGTVSGARMAALIARLEALPAARPCTTGLPGTYATLEYVRRGWYDDGLYVELDGCRRFSRPDHSLGQLDAATAGLVTSLTY